MVVQEWEGEGVSNLCFVKTNNDASPVQSSRLSLDFHQNSPSPLISLSEKTEELIICYCQNF